LSTQGKDVNVIKSSNIVTGKNPIKVELANPIPGLDAQSPALPNLSWTQSAGRPKDGKAVTIINFRVDGFLNLPAFIALCDRPCSTIEAGAIGASATGILRSNNPNV